MLWIVYCLLHSLLASTGVKQKLQQGLKENYKYYRLFYTLFAFVFLVLLILYQIHIPTIELYKPTVAIIVIGLIVGAAGLALMIVCIKKYFISLSGLLSLVKDSGSSSLMITGIHRYVRHPLYLGTFAAIWGAFLTRPFLSLFIANAIITLYTLMGIRLEENKLRLEFGESYQSYQRSVPKLIPALKFKRKG